jgi:preprotein translocase subunit YajC
MQKNLEPGTRVMTTSGMFAHVVEVTDDGVVLEIAPGVEAEFVQQAIMKVVEEEPLEEDVEEETGEPAAAAVGTEDEAPSAVEDEVPPTVEAKTSVENTTSVEHKAETVEDDKAQDGVRTEEKAAEKPSA